MNGQAANSYLKTKVLTATPEQLQLMLYDGAIRFCDQARVAIQEKSWEQSYHLITRVQRIIVEMLCALKHDVSPDLCGKLASLYNFAYRKLIEANIEHDIAALNEAANVLRFQRETWVMLLDKLSRQKATTVARKLDLPAPDARMEASISVQG
ncbi:MAG: flagellar export chaperone FliS [Tepidisphaerales bacterium]